MYNKELCLTKHDVVMNAYSGLKLVIVRACLKTVDISLCIFTFQQTQHRELSATPLCTSSPAVSNYCNQVS